MNAPSAGFFLFSIDVEIEKKDNKNCCSDISVLYFIQEIMLELVPAPDNG